MDFEIKTNNMDKKKFEGEGFGPEVDVVEAEPVAADTNLSQEKQIDRENASHVIDKVTADIESMENTNEAEKNGIEQLKQDMFEDLISRVEAKLAETKPGTDKFERLSKMANSFKNGQAKGGNPITLIENMRMTYGISMADEIAAELVSEKNLKKKMVDYINGSNFRNEAMKKYAERFQSKSVSKEDIAALVSTGASKSAGAGSYGM